MPRQLALLPVLLALSAVAWFATSQLSDPGMRVGILTGSPDGAIADAAMPIELPLAIALFMATWTVMMVAMMFPAVAPVVLTFDRSAQTKARPRSVTVTLILGYLLVWSLIGLAACAVVAVLQMLVPVGDPTARRVGGGLLVIAGTYELTPLKDICLRHCRSPLGIVIAVRGPARGPPQRPLPCRGGAWQLLRRLWLGTQLVLVLLGIMNVAWMGAVAALIFAEKVLPGGELLSRVSGFAFIVAGAALRPESSRPRGR